MRMHLQLFPLTHYQLTVPVLVAMDGDDVLCGVEEPLAIIGPEQGAG